MRVQQQRSLLLQFLAQLLDLRLACCNRLLCTSKLLPRKSKLCFKRGLLLGKLIGGSLAVRSAPGQGTKIIATANAPR